MESESGENFGCFLVVWKPLLVRFCFVVWVLFGVFSIFCMTSFGDCNCPQHQETSEIFCFLTRQKKRMRITQLDLEKESEICLDLIINFCHQKPN